MTFLNGQPEPGLVIPVPQSSGPPVLYINPATLFPSQPHARSDADRPVQLRAHATRPGTPYSQVIGDITPGPLPYLCLLHDTSGMKGTLVVLPR